jgi:hypothetical protein
MLGIRRCHRASLARASLPQREAPGNATLGLSGFEVETVSPKDIDSAAPGCAVVFLVSVNPFDSAALVARADHDRVS